MHFSLHGDHVCSEIEEISVAEYSNITDGVHCYYITDNIYKT